ncbi:MAG: N-acetyltransferase [Desulfobacterales bacterium]|nr:N-acetyltransferase [Desulfobacterales bacterium]
MIRKAQIQDVKVIHSLLKIYGDKGELISRPLTKLFDHLRDFSVFIDDKTEKILGCCALQFCWEDLAEIRSLAVYPDHTGKGVGTSLTASIIEEAQTYQIKELFTLTYRPGFFKRFGFNKIEREALPLKVWGDCLACVKFPDCDETAMIKKL